MASNNEAGGDALVRPVVCVFCASSPGANPAHLESARTLGKSLTAAGYDLVYGGGTMGIMGEVAKTFVSQTGPTHVEGIIPRALIQTSNDTSSRNAEKNNQTDTTHDGGAGDTKQAERTMSHDQLKRIDNAENGESGIPMSDFGRTTVVPDMHTRKRMMAQRVISGGRGSGFVALAGGYGTIEEVMEMVTWNQLGIHKSPIVVVNIDGYWDGLLQWVRRSIDEGFVGKGNANILVEVKNTDDVAAALADYKVAEGRFKLDWSSN